MDRGKKDKGPPAPFDRKESVRREIMSALGGNRLSARDISGAVRVSEKDVYEHLSHIQKTLRRGGQKLVIAPPECRKCEFAFKKRGRLKKPGRCPVYNPCVHSFSAPPCP
jgi:predicted Zn-ribbon and HTH transcriptional regulator